MEETLEVINSAVTQMMLIMSDGGKSNVEITNLIPVMENILQILMASASLVRQNEPHVSKFVKEEYGKSQDNFNKNIEKIRKNLEVYKLCVSEVKQRRETSDLIILDLRGVLKDFTTLMVLSYFSDILLLFRHANCFSGTSTRFMEVGRLVEFADVFEVDKKEKEIFINFYCVKFVDPISNTSDENRMRKKELLIFYRNSVENAAKAYWYQIESNLRNKENNGVSDMETVVNKLGELKTEIENLLNFVYSDFKSNLLLVADIDFDAILANSFKENPQMCYISVSNANLTPAKIARMKGKAEKSKGSQEARIEDAVLRRREASAAAIKKTPYELLLEKIMALINFIKGKLEEKEKTNVLTEEIIKDISKKAESIIEDLNNEIKRGLPDFGVFTKERMEMLLAEKKNLEKKNAKLLKNFGDHQKNPNAGKLYRSMEKEKGSLFLLYKILLNEIKNFLIAEFENLNEDLKHNFEENDDFLDNIAQSILAAEIMAENEEDPKKKEKLKEEVEKLRLIEARIKQNAKSNDKDARQKRLKDLHEFSRVLTDMVHPSEVGKEEVESCEDLLKKFDEIFEAGNDVDVLNAAKDLIKGLNRLEQANNALLSDPNLDKEKAKKLMEENEKLKKLTPKLVAMVKEFVAKKSTFDKNKKNQLLKEINANLKNIGQIHIDLLDEKYKFDLESELKELEDMKSSSKALSQAKNQPHDEKILEAAALMQGVLMESEKKGKGMDKPEMVEGRKKLIKQGQEISDLMAKMSNAALSSNKAEVLELSKSIICKVKPFLDAAFNLANSCQDVRLKNDVLTWSVAVNNYASALKVISTVHTSAAKNDKTSNDLLSDACVSLAKAVASAMKATDAASFHKSVRKPTI